MKRPRLLQVCNVGQICGGTAACAWSVTRALPAFEHVVAVLGVISPETRQAFAPVALLSCPQVTPEWVHPLRPDLVLLHNTPPGKVPQRLRVPTVQYQHSAVSVAAADVHLCCSHWLAERVGRSAGAVLWQGVPRPELRGVIPRAISAGTGLCWRAAGDERALEDRILVGRLCTPRAAKWPDTLLPCYAEWSERFPNIDWEFVGCPAELQPEFQRVCQGRARFWSPSWDRRALLTRWHAILYHQPSLPESFGRVVAEAMRAGCIPVVDAQGGFVEQLSAGGGWLCANRPSFTHALEKLHDPAWRDGHSRLARELAEERWSLAAFASRLLPKFDAAWQRYQHGA